MALKQFKPDNNRPHLVAIYDIESSASPPGGVAPKQCIYHFSGVVLNTDTGKITNLLMRTEAAGTNVFVAGVNTPRNVEKTLRSNEPLLYTGKASRTPFSDKVSERTKPQNAKIPAFYDDGVILYIMPLPEKYSDSPQTLASHKKLLITESLRDRLNKMGSAKQTMGEIDTIPMGSPELITEKNEHSYFQSQPCR